MAINWRDITEEVNCSQTEVGSNDLVHEHKVLPGKLRGPSMLITGSIVMKNFMEDGNTVMYNLTLINL